MAVAGSWLDFPSLVVQLSYWTATATAGRRSFCRGPALFCVGARRFVSGPGGPLPALFLSAGAPCVGARRSLCRGPALCVVARRSVSGPGAFCVGARRSFFCVGGRRCRGSASGPSAPLARLSLSGPGSLCVGPRRFLSRSLSGPGCPLPCLCRGPALLVSGRSLRRGPALLVSGPGGPLPALFVSGPDALCRGLALLASGPAAPSLCRGPALCARRFVSGPGALCRGPALFVSGPGALRGPALFLSGSGALWSLDCFSIGARRSCAFCVGARRSPAVTLCRDPALCVGVCVGARGSGGVGLCVAVSVSQRCLCRGPGPRSARPT